MNTSIVAIPLLAAIWVGAPIGASAQEPAPAAEVEAPRTAVPRPAERRTRAAEPRGRAAEPPARPAEPRDREAVAPNTPPPAEQRQARGRNPSGRSPSGQNPSGPAPSARDQRGRDNNRPSPRVAVPRPRNVPPIVGSNYPRQTSYRRQAYYPPAYYDRWARRTYRWSPLGYAPWSWIYGSVGLSSYGYYSYGNYGAYGPYGYGPYGYGMYGQYGRSTTYDTGGVRLRIRPRDASVFVDGYYAGLVDDFDGTFQALRLEQGGHKIEIRMPGFETLELDIHVQPGRTITLREDLIPRP